MRVAIDRVGRIVIPKPMRDALGIDGPTELELTERDGALELTLLVEDRAEEVEGLRDRFQLDGLLEKLLGAQQLPFAGMRLPASAGCTRVKCGNERK